MLVSVLSKLAFERLSMFYRRVHLVLKGSTIKGKNILPKGSILFPLRVAPWRIDKYSFKCIKLEKNPKLDYANTPVF